MKKVKVSLIVFIFGTIFLSFQNKNSVPTIAELIALKNDSETQLRLKLRLKGFQLVREPDTSAIDGSVTFMFNKFRVADNPKTEEIIQYTKSLNSTYINYRTDKDLFVHYQSDLKLNKFVLKKCSDQLPSNTFCYSNSKHNITFGEMTLKHTMYMISIFE